MAAAAARIARLKRIDRAAVGVITLGGLAIVVAVLGILVFIAAEAVPLFRGARLVPDGEVRLATGLDAANAASLRAIGTDEYRRFVFTVEPDGQVAFYRLDNGDRALTFPVAGLDGAAITSTSRSLEGNFLGVGLDDGRVALLQVRYIPQYVDQVLSDITVTVRERGVAVADTARRPVRQVSYVEQEGSKYVAAVVADDEIAYWWTGADEAEHVATLKVAAPHRVTQIRIGRNGAVIAGTDRGAVYHWELLPELRLTDVSPVSERPITALEWVLGGNSYVAGSEDGALSGWFRAPVLEDGAYAMVRAHAFEPQAGAVTALAMSTRERSFAASGADGSVVMRHQTSQRTLARLAGHGVPRAVLITPKADGLLVLGAAGRLERFRIDNPHPEISWHTLFGKVWYEGYGQAEYVWQSTGATDDFEAKFSLVPLVFGTIKGTFYALLFAIPLAVFAALYTSQFVHPTIRAKIKPTVEIMAALPSVVIGFLAGLYLASVVERNLTAVFLMMVLMPVSGTLGVFLWHALPGAIVGRLKVGTEVLVILPILLAAAAVSVSIGPEVERVVFGGDMRVWLLDVFGLTYDQRNCLVVGLAMGFAVIPIIFTISEDAFSSVPSSLTAASLALGASRWQTAIRVVLPTASPGVFSAVMIGFGRAVGETMIVLMATGNTPVMDWSIFNGIRTLSANIAVEIPEAPQGGTLYRVLFLAGALLFTMTFAVNTIAEIIRQRLRDRYRAI
jgi:phosphate transport system permease protein